jgi:hypothetical protein
MKYLGKIMWGTQMIHLPLEQVTIRHQYISGKS